jgi:hypothetical protein
MKKFDLNIEKVLEHWKVSHAIREVIANAIDEQQLTGTKEIEIFEDGQRRWHIRDYGRGLKYEHLTQKENEEKLKHPELVIGKFGVGLKDALATFDRHDIKVEILSKYGDISIAKSTKHDFDDIVTLHAIVNEASVKDIVGTDVILEGCSGEDIEEAKSFFLKFSGEEILERTEYGQVLRKNDAAGRIYINGLRVAEEENSLFSYNITSLNKKMREALSRERTNVGRTAYADRIKAILLQCRTSKVAQLLVEDLKSFEQGTIHDELSWIDVQVHACKILNAQEKVVFLTSRELMDAKDMVDRARSDGYQIVTIPENLRDKIGKDVDSEGNPIRDLTEFTKEWNDSFEFKFVEPKKLSNSERLVFEQTEKILALIGGRPPNVKEILISETMRMQVGIYSEAAGLWEERKQRIIIKRTQLRDLKSYAGTLLHEIAHARSGAPDISQMFEEELTALLGLSSAKTLSKS